MQLNTPASALTESSILLTPVYPLKIFCFAGVWRNKMLGFHVLGTPKVFLVMMIKSKVSEDDAKSRKNNTFNQQIIGMLVNDIF